MRFVVRFAFATFGVFVAIVPRTVAGAVLGPGPWSRPVDGPVVRSFDPPETRFGPGHLGVDFAAPPGTPVRAAGDGTVVFAGHVGKGLHVVVRHAGDIRTTDSFLATIAVGAGEHVGRGQILGTSGGTGPDHGADVVHFGVRVGAGYVDPMLLFRPVDLAAVVHLAAPHGGAAASSAPETADARPVAEERGPLVDALRVDARAVAPLPAWWDEVRPAQPDDPPFAARDPKPGITERAPRSTPIVPRPALALGLAAAMLVGLSAARPGRGRVVGQMSAARKHAAPRERHESLRGVPTTLPPGPVGPGLGDGGSAQAGRRPDHT